MKKLVMLGILFLAGTGIAAADGVSIGFSFGDDGYRYRRAYRPAYYYDDCGPRYRTRYYRTYRRPGYYYYDDDYYYRPRRRVVVYRDCD